jgi:hypothetical protein
MVLLTIDRPADDEGFSAWFDVHKKHWAKCWATDQPNPPKQPTILGIYTQKSSS